MFVLVRAFTFSALFVGFVLIYGPAQVLSAAGVVRPAADGLPQILGMIVAAIGWAVALWSIFTLPLSEEALQHHSIRLGDW